VQAMVRLEKEEIVAIRVLDGNGESYGVIAMQSQK
jgi:hypothetical protein